MGTPNFGTEELEARPYGGASFGTVGLEAEYMRGQANRLEVTRQTAPTWRERNSARRTMNASIDAADKWDRVTVGDEVDKVLYGGVTRIGIFGRKAS